MERRAKFYELKNGNYYRRGIGFVEECKHNGTTYVGDEILMFLVVNREVGIEFSKNGGYSVEWENCECELCQEQAE